MTVPIIDKEGNIIGLRGYKIDAQAGGEDVIVVGETKSPIVPIVTEESVGHAPHDNPAERKGEGGFKRVHSA